MTIPADAVQEAARLAHAAGISRVTVAEVFVRGPDEERRLVSVETSTPKARAFIESFLGSATLSRTDYTLTSREVRAIVDGESLASLTRPMREPFTDVLQDLWQLGHVTASYVARAAAGAILLATGIIEANPVVIVVAALFTPFSRNCWRSASDFGIAIAASSCKVSGLSSSVPCSRFWRRFSWPYFQSGWELQS